MKVLLTLIIMAIPLVASGQEILATAADTGRIDAGWIGSNAISTTDLASWGWYGEDTLLLSVSSGCVKHDTTKEYVKEIADKCDTTWGKHWVKYKKIDGEQYFKRMAKIDSVHCYIDTVWADKKLVYFTPDELKKLRELIRCH